MTAFRHAWECFPDNCRTRSIPSDCVTIDEQLVPFRGRCRFLQYMPSKPAKYGLKIFWMCNARVPYALNAVDGINSSEDTYRCLAICHHISVRHKQSIPSVKSSKVAVVKPLFKKPRFDTGLFTGYNQMSRFL